MQGFQIRIEPLSKGNLLKFMGNGLMHSFADPIILRTPDFLIGMIGVIELQEQLVRMRLLSGAAQNSVLRSVKTLKTGIF